MSENEVMKEIYHFRSIMNVIKFTNPNNDLYYKLNLRDTFSNNTFQFRMFSSTLDHVSVNNQVKLILKFVDSSRKRDFPKSFDIKRNLQYKTDKFFEWMILDPELILFWNN